MRLYDLAAKGALQALAEKNWSRRELDARDADGRTALMCAAFRGDHKTAELLRDMGADLDLTDPDGRKAVDLAALNGHSAVLVCLMRGGCGG
ncbi:ankyrin repeat domain-containing protein [Ruminococcaceae bacterium OttesenSCG-928-A11]|nr:ankyrin repeat domain-containing protein [Ruminococcaceae bacterium OttesenSCG-928-A11]